MGLQIRAYVGNNQEYIDLYPDESISMDVSFAQVQDITKKNSPYSKEFKVPGSKNNNQIFNYFFDLNSIFVDWNPQAKFEADLLYDGYVIYTGYVRLNNVSINKTEKVYSITFYTAVGDLVANIGDLAMCNINTSSLNHSLYDDDITELIFSDPSLHNPSAAPNPSTFPTNPVSTGDVQYILGQRGYDYTATTTGTITDINVASTPILNFSGVSGFFDFSGTPLISTYLIPSVRTRKLYELIVNQAGYQIESNFFETDYFGRYYIPLAFNSNNPFMAQADPYIYGWINTTGQTTAVSQQVRNLGTGVVTTPNMLVARTITGQTLNFNPLVDADWTFLGLSSNQLECMFSLPQSNGNNYTYQITFGINSVAAFGFPPYIYAGGAIQLWRFRQNTGTIINCNLIQSQNYNVNLAAPNISNVISFTGNVISEGQISGQDLFFLAYTKTSGLPFVVTGASFSVIKSPDVLPQTIELHKEMSCDQKQIDFIQNINKTFNLVVVEHPDKLNTLIIEPMVNYIGKGQLLDWTDKVDFDSTQSIFPTTDLVNGSIFLANKRDKDFINTEYNKKTNKIFGQNIIDLNQDYKNSTTNLVQSLGQNTDFYLNASGDTNISLPCYFISKESNNNGISTFEYRPFLSLPRQVFKSVSLPTGNTSSNPIFYRFRGSNIPFTNTGLEPWGTIPNVNRLTTYPYAIQDFSHYTIYDSREKFFTDELVYPELDNQYDRYYRDYIEDLTADENKIYRVKMYMTPWEIADLYFNETIIIKNTYFRINKITNLSLLAPGMCDVELVKLTRDYEPTPTLFYDLIACNNTCDVIHTHTDICFPVWAFEGKYVDIVVNSGGTVVRYYVIRTEYNPNYNYTIPFFRYDITTTPDYYIYWDYRVYSDCSASVQDFELPLRNEIDTPYTGDCVSMNITNTGSTEETFYFEYCDGTSGSWTLTPSASINVCGLYSSFMTSGFTYCLDTFTPCTSGTTLPTPTPTSTPNKPTPTPTMTMTPTTTPNKPTPTPTMTPTSTLYACKKNQQLSVTDTGWIKYTLCDGTIQYVNITSTGTYTITDCFRFDTLSPGFPYADVAVYTEIGVATPCP